MCSSLIRNEVDLIQTGIRYSLSVVIIHYYHQINQRFRPDGRMD